MVEKERLASEVHKLVDRIGQLSEQLERVQREARGQSRVSQEFENRHVAIQAQLASVTGERERLGAALADVSGQLADLKRSRLLRWGRSLRRLAGLPVRY
jgi:chromosome segregation ATPase